MVMKVHQEDLTKGGWRMSDQEITVWMDASSLATGEELEVNGDILMDACWLCQNFDSHYINKLDATIRA